MLALTSASTAQLCLTNRRVHNIQLYVVLYSPSVDCLKVVPVESIPHTYPRHKCQWYHAWEQLKMGCNPA